MNGKKKISAILAILMLTVSFLIAIPIPVSAAPANARIYLSLFMWKYPNGSVYYDTSYPFDTDLVPYLYYPAYGPLSPFNITLNYPADADKLGALPILAVIVENTTVGGFTMSSWEFGVKWNSEVLGYPVTFAQIAPAGLPATIFQAEYLAGNANYTAGTINIFHGEVKGFMMARNDSVSTPVTTARVMCYIIPNILNYGETLLDIASYVKIDDQGVDITPTNIINGYFKFRIHEIKIPPTLWVDTGTSGNYHIGDTLTVPISIITTEPVHSWELNLSYYGLDEYGSPTTPTISCPSTANVSEGHFLLLSNRTSPHGGNSFTPSVGAGWVKATGDYNVASQYADAWSGSILMVVNFTVLAHGTTILHVTQCSIKDPTGAEITPQPNVDLDEGLRMNYFNFEKLVSIAPIFLDTMSTVMTWSHPPKNIGETFNVAVNIIDTSQNVHSWKAGFRFNPKVLEVLAVTEGTYLSGQGATTFNPNIEINNTIGEVSNITCTGEFGVDNSGFGTLFIITFNVTGYGRSLISFTDKDGDVTETVLRDNANQEIRNPGGLAFAVSVFEFRAPVTVEMTLGSRFKHVDPGEVFTVTLTIDSLENIHSWMSGLNFNKDMLTCTDVVYGDFFAGIGTLQNQTVKDNTNGYVSVGQVSLGDDYASGSGTLAIITFEVAGWTCDVTDFPFGPSDLTFTDEIGQPTQTLVLDWSGDGCTLTDLLDGGVVIYCDANNDGRVTSTDVSVNNALLTKIMLEIITPQEALDQNPFCDVNASGGLTSTDVSLQNSALTKLMLEICPWW